MPEVALEILLIFLLMVANGIFALSEMAIVSARKARLQQWAEAGDKKAAVALELANAPDRFLSTVQIGITLVGILTGAFGGATLARVISEWVEGIPALAPYSGTLALLVVVVAITYLSLIIGELVPKRLALSNPERVAARIAVPMRALSRLAAPLVWLLSLSSDAVGRLLGMRPSAEAHITEDELKVILHQGTEAGVFERAEREMVEGVFRLTDRRVAALATPRGEVAWLDVLDKPEEIRRTMAERHHSYFAVCEGQPDHVLGIVHTRDLLVRCLEGEPFDLQACLQPALFVPESMRLPKLLERFRENQTHVAVVLDEHGGTFGLITLVDVLEAVVGAVPLPGDEPPPQVVPREDGSWLVDGLLPVDDLADALDLRSLPQEEHRGFETLGGLVAAQLGRIPAVGDYFEWSGLRFEVVDMDGLRVDQVLVTRR